MFRVRFKETASQAQARIIEATQRKLAAVLKRHKLVLTGQDKDGFACYVRLPQRRRKASKVANVALKPRKRIPPRPTVLQMRCEGTWKMPKRLRRIWYGRDRACLESATIFMADGAGYCDHHGRKQLGRDAYWAAKDAARQVRGEAS